MPIVAVLALLWLSISPAEAQDRAEITVLAPAPQSAPISIASGGSLEVRVRVQNTGSTTWSPVEPTYRDNAYFLSVGYGDPNTAENYSGDILPLPQPISPGSSIEVSGRITVPARPGRYAVAFSMILAGVYRFAGNVLNSPAEELALDSRFLIDVVEQPLRMSCIQQIRNVGQDFSASCPATGGLPPYRWELTFGQLPSGVTFNPGTGVFSGVPTVAGQFPVTVRVTDSKQPPATASNSPLLNVLGSPISAINCSTPPVRRVGENYQSICSATGGEAPFRWSATGLPPGLTMGATGVISGSPHKLAISLWGSLRSEPRAPALSGSSQSPSNSLARHPFNSIAVCLPRARSVLPILPHVRCPAFFLPDLLEVVGRQPISLRVSP